jgi:hypothetical protein
MMNRLIALAAALSFALCSCATDIRSSETDPTTSTEHRTTSRPLAESPCSDTTYVRLKGRPIEALTASEYRYRIEMDAACRRYRELENARGSEEGANDEVTSIMVRGLLGACLMMLLSVAVSGML